MPTILKIELLIIVILYIIFICREIFKEKISIQNSIIWLLLGFLMMIFLFIPNTLLLIANKIGIETISNMLLFAGFLCLLIICFNLTEKISGEKKKNNMLIQEIGIMKNEIERKNKGKK